jgi:hypothetical protein
MRQIRMQTIALTYLGVSKSSEGGTICSFRKLEKYVFSYESIERLSFYFSMLFDHHSTSTIIIELAEIPDDDWEN